MGPTITCMNGYYESQKLLLKIIYVFLCRNVNALDSNCFVKLVVIYQAEWNDNVVSNNHSSRNCGMVGIYATGNSTLIILCNQYLASVVWWNTQISENKINSSNRSTQRIILCTLFPINCLQKSLVRLNKSRRHARVQMNQQK
jgi:hypothetical protein